ncbi:MAG: hypothetical protein AAF798_03890 [Bacteroidota bacterium]
MQSASPYIIRKEVIFDRLLPLVEPMGFELHTKLNQFRKITPNGFQTLIVSLSPYDEMCVLEIHLGIRNHQVENIVFPFTNGLPGFRQDSMTVVTSMGRIAGKRFWRFELREMHDLNLALATIREFMQQQGWDFLNQHTPLTTLESTLQQDQQRAVPLIQNVAHRCMRSLVIHKLLYRPHFEQLVATHQTIFEVQVSNPALRKRYEELVIFLRHYSMN